MRHAGTRTNSADACAPAFTLIEIVVSLTILAVVAAVAIPTLNLPTTDDDPAPF